MIVVSHQVLHNATAYYLTGRFTGPSLSLLLLPQIVTACHLFLKEESYAMVQ